MSAAATLARADHVLQSRGVHRALGAYVVGCVFTPEGAVFALGDGTLRFTALTDRQFWREARAHEGAVLALAAEPAGGVLTGGDDGRLRHTAWDGTAREIARFGSKWVEHVATHPGGGKPLAACAVGREVHVFEAAGERRKTLAHPSTVAGLAFDTKGKRVAACHYNGAALWFVAARTDSPRQLEWKGSHIGIAISPDGDNVVTAMQENALHGWRLSDGQHMRMSGYPAKSASIGFTRSGKWLASSGAEAIVLWPFTGGGPMGKAPLELAGGDGVLCTRIACHPEQEVVAAGFSDGLVLLAEIASQRILPVAAPGRGPVSALAWSANGATLAFGTEEGFAAIVDFSQRTA